MRLSLKDIDKRGRIRLDKCIKTDSQRGIVAFGDKNDYPQLIERLINGSKTGKACSKIYSKFLAGQGFENEAINSIEISTDSRGKKITVHELLKQICINLSKNNGAYIHFDVNLNAEISNPKSIPFKYCRFTATDDKQYSPFVAVYDNWDMDNEGTTRKNKQFDKTKIKEYNVFNLNQKVVENQILKSGGIENYKGQVYFLFLDNEFLYPLSPFDSVYLDLDSENQISIYKNNIIRNGFSDATIFRIAAADEDQEDKMTDSIYDMLGADGTKTMVLVDDINPETGEIDSKKSIVAESVKSNLNPDLFENWEMSLANSIRKAASAMPALLIDYEEGKLSTTSGESIIQATNFYNAMTTEDRESISQAFSEIFKNSVIPELKNNTNWKIKPLELYANTTVIQPTTSDKTDIS